MLFFETIEPDTLSLLRSLSDEKFLKDFRLVGGTSLALQIGHRISIDLDFFGVGSHLGFTAEDIGTEIEVVNKTKTILNTFIKNIKVDFVSTPYPFISEPLVYENISLASMKDIGAMKLSAITGRGSKKDFVDIHFLLKQFSLRELLGFYSRKYQDASMFLLYKSLLYFDDADQEPLPKMTSHIIWDEIKESIQKEVKKQFP